MSVFYRLHQDKSKNTSRTGKWYARMVPTTVVDTRQLAAIMQRNCTVKKSDILAVLDELVETMRDQLQDSKRVKLDGFGSFKIGLSSIGAATANEFSASSHIKGMHIVFTPERTSDSTGARTKQFLQGAKAEELPLNVNERKKGSLTPNPSPTGSPSQTSPTGEENSGGGSQAPSTGGGADQPDMD